MTSYEKVQYLKDIKEEAARLEYLCFHNYQCQISECQDLDRGIVQVLTDALELFKENFSDAEFCTELFLALESLPRPKTKE